MISVLFENHHLYYLPHFMPIMQEFLNRGGYKISASMPRSVDRWEQRYFADAISNLDVEAITADDETIRITGLRNQKFDVILVGNVGRVEDIAANDSIAVMVYHGIGLKQSYYRDISPRIDLRAVESKARLRQLKANGATNLVLTGFTKLDPLVKGLRKSREEVLQECGLCAERPTVLYSPSFYPSSLEKLLPELPPLSERVNFIIKLHNFSWHQKRYRYQGEYACQLANHHANIYLVPPEQFNILPFYVAADVLISDISSTLFEYLAVDRPIIQTQFFSLRLKHRIFWWRLAKRIDRERANEIDFSYSLAVPKDLGQLLPNVLDHRDEMSDTRVRAAKRHLYMIDGLASARLVDAIESKLREKKKA